MTIVKTYYKVMDFDSNSAIFDGEFEFGPVESKTYSRSGVQNEELLLGMLGKLVGLAVVTEPEVFTVVGTLETISLVRLPLTNYAKNYRDAVELLEMEESPRHDLVEFKKDRVPVVQIQHKVAELYPSLRVWESTYDVEVELSPVAGDLRLGGCVWKREAYLTDEGNKFLGF